jgi:hypothetical protein
MRRPGGRHDVAPRNTPDVEAALAKLRVRWDLAPIQFIASKMRHLVEPSDAALQAEIDRDSVELRPSKLVLLRLVLLRLVYRLLYEPAELLVAKLTLVREIVMVAAEAERWVLALDPTGQTATMVSLFGWPHELYSSDSEFQ